MSELQVLGNMKMSVADDGSLLMLRVHSLVHLGKEGLRRERETEINPHHSFIPLHLAFSLVLPLTGAGDVTHSLSEFLSSHGQGDCSSLCVSS